MPPPEISGQKQHGFQPGRSGNPAGKPKGTRSRALAMLDKIGQDNASEIVQSVIAQAKTGDVRAAEAILSRAWPVRRGHPVTLPALPAMQTPADLVAALGTVAQAVAAGTITPEEGQAVASVLDMQRRVIETADLATRVETLERVKL